jgi:hypothetical protein
VAGLFKLNDIKNMTISVKYFCPLSEWELDPEGRATLHRSDEGSKEYIYKKQVNEKIQRDIKEWIELSGRTWKIMSEHPDWESESSPAFGEVQNLSRQIKKLMGQLKELNKEFTQIKNKDSEQAERTLFSNGEIKYIVDKTTGDKYFNESHWIICLKGLALIPGSILWGAARVVEIVSKRFAAIVHGDQPLKHLMHLLLYPFYIAMMVLSAFYTVLCPCSGRKCFAAWERCLYDGLETLQKRPYIAPCFQPQIFGDGTLGPQNQHFFSEDPNEQNSF